MRQPIHWSAENRYQCGLAQKEELSQRDSSLENEVAAGSEVFVESIRTTILIDLFSLGRRLGRERSFLEREIELNKEIKGTLRQILSLIVTH